MDNIEQLEKDIKYYAEKHYNTNYGIYSFSKITKERILKNSGIG